MKNKSYSELQTEIKRLKEEVSRLNARLCNGRDYLMEVLPSEITVEECLKAFNWTASGMEN
jgi:predicted  nucleic acid-binding Zn-ribbon protein